jgi:hypothetical protein
MKPIEVVLKGEKGRRGQETILEGVNLIKFMIIS